MGQNTSKILEDQIKIVEAQPKRHWITPDIEMISDSEILSGPQFQTPEAGHPHTIDYSS